MKQNKPVPDVGDSKYQPTSEELTALERYLRRRAGKPAPRMKVLNAENKVTIAPRSSGRARR